MGVENLHSMFLREPRDGLHGAEHGCGILALLDDRMRECRVPQPFFQLVISHESEQRLDAGLLQSLGLGQRRSSGASPSVERSQMKNSHCGDQQPGDRLTCMAVDAELLEILACPICKEEVKPVSLSERRRTEVRDKYRDKFRGEEPVVEQGLRCVKCGRIYPVVSDIPVMLIDEAFQESS